MPRLALAREPVALGRVAFLATRSIIRSRSLAADLAIALHLELTALAGELQALGRSLHPLFERRSLLALLLRHRRLSLRSLAFLDDALGAFLCELFSLFLRFLRLASFPGALGLRRALAQLGVQ